MPPKIEKVRNFDRALLRRVIQNCTFTLSQARQVNAEANLIGMALVHDKEVAEFAEDAPKVTPNVTPMGRYASNLINVKYSQAIDNVQNRKFARETA